jgi:hypothetical protein
MRMNATPSAVPSAASVEWRPASTARMLVGDDDLAFGEAIGLVRRKPIDGDHLLSEVMWVLAVA